MAVDAQQNTEPLVAVIETLGRRLGFETKREVQASESAWVDLVWFDPRLGLAAFPRPNLRRHPVLPVVGFEVEVSTGLDAKHVKGSASNLSNLGAAMGVIVIGTAVLADLRRSRRWSDAPDTALEKEAIQRVYRWYVR